MKKAFARAVVIALCVMTVCALVLPASAGAAAAAAAVTFSPIPVQQSKNGDGNIVIDYTYAADGYVSVSAKISGSPKLAVVITTPKNTQYKYFSTDSTGAAQKFVLSEGDGSYKVTVYKNVSGTKYTALHSKTISVRLSGDTAPFLCPNIFVDYTANTSCVRTASELCSKAGTELEKVDAIYYYVVNNFAYDYDKAKTVESGYRPELDTVWKAKKGICFDYASTMAAMLRSQGVATKLVVGYAGTTYHAWINIYTKDKGWIEAVIYFDGRDWKLMDPTFASTGKSSAKIMDFISNTANYSAKYVY